MDARLLEGLLRTLGPAPFLCKLPKLSFATLARVITLGGMSACRPILLLLALAAQLLPAQQTAQTPPPPQEVIAKLKEAQDLKNAGKFTYALEKLDEVEALAPDTPHLPNLRGTIYLAPPLRDLDKAAALFDEAIRRSPGDMVPLFHKAELLYVRHDWQAAHAAFEKLLTDFPKTPMPIRHMILFKRLVCEVKLERLGDAEKTLKDSFTFMDDTAAYYYAQAALAFGRKDEAKAKEWLARAEGIYKKEDRTTYEDSLMEARWLPNIGLPLLEKK